MLKLPLHDLKAEMCVVIRDHKREPHILLFSNIPSAGDGYSSSSSTTGKPVKGHNWKLIMMIWV